jgi:hypothetical protein
MAQSWLRGDYLKDELTTGAIVYHTVKLPGAPQPGDSQRFHSGHSDPVPLEIMSSIRRT